MGRWRGGDFKDYIREKLYLFEKGMLTAMKQDFEFFMIAGEHTASCWMSLEPQWLVIISLLQNKNKN